MTDDNIFLEFIREKKAVYIKKSEIIAVTEEEPHLPTSVWVKNSDKPFWVDQSAKLVMKMIRRNE